MAAQLLLLKPGVYRWSLIKGMDHEVVGSGEWSLTSDHRALPFTLPPEVECTLNVDPTGR
jgi:hypothetical protein